MPLLAVPRGAQDLTAEWLTAALSEVADGACVQDLAAIPIRHGNLADSVRLVPRWDRPTPGPPSVVAKVPTAKEPRRSDGFATRTYELESAFYSQLASTVSVNRPLCYAAGCDPEQQGYVVLLEDLSPAEAGDQVLGCSPEDAAAVMPELAALHAPRWGDPGLLDLAWLDRPTVESVQGFSEVVFSRFPGFVDRYRTRVDPEVLRVGERLMGALEDYLADRPGPWTVLHGEFRLDNLLFGCPRVAVVDWHAVRIGPGLSDVSYFIGSGLLPDDRRDSEGTLVRAYHRHLGAAGVELPWDECWAAYRRYSFDGLILGIAAAMLVPPIDGNDEMFVAMVERHGRQALDLGAEEFLPG
jgi:hypothetical protein